MKTMRCCLCLAVAAVFLFEGALFAEGAERFKINSKTTSKNISSGQGDLPDLLISDLNWSAPPEVGDEVGRSAILNVVVMNKGSAPAGSSRLKIECNALSANACPPSMNGNLSVSPLDPGIKTVLPWPSMSGEKWPAGRFRLTVRADAANMIRESNETNNLEELTFSVAPRQEPSFSQAPRGGTLKMVDKPDIIITGISPSPPLLKAGDDVRFDVTYKNIGAAMSTRSEGQVVFRTGAAGGDHFSGSVKTMLPILSPGQSYTVRSDPGKLVTSYGAPVGGDFTLEATADTLNRNDEINEGNNTLTDTMSVQRRTDLYIPYFGGQNLDKEGSGFKQDKLSVYKGNKVYLTIQIQGWTRFFGNVTSPGKVVVKATDFADYVVPSQFIKRDLGAAGATRFTFSMFRTWDTPGQKRVTVHVDVDNQVAESNELNNTGLLIVDVY